MHEDEGEIQVVPAEPGPAVEALALTIADAARTAGTDRRAIRRLLDAGDFSGAFKDEQGFWRIPVADLERAGLMVDGHAVSQLSLSTTPAQPAAVELILELAQMEARAEKAEALLEAEKRLNEELRTALDVERRTLATILGDDRPPTPPAPEIPAVTVRPNWQRELRAARAREQQQRAARAREGQR